ncbi:MAG: acyl carrier protein [Sediminibacterium sp.]
MPTLNALRRLLQQKLNIDTSSLSTTTNLKQDLEMSDWEWDYLMNSIEQACEISLPASEINQVVNVKHLLVLVKKQRVNSFRGI